MMMSKTFVTISPSQPLPLLSSRFFFAIKSLEKRPNSKVETRHFRHLLLRPSLFSVLPNYVPDNFTTRTRRRRVSSSFLPLSQKGRRWNHVFAKFFLGCGGGKKSNGPLLIPGPRSCRPDSIKYSAWRNESCWTLDLGSNYCLKKGVPAKDRLFGQWMITAVRDSIEKGSR